MRRGATACCALALLVSLGSAARAAQLEDEAVEIGPGISPPWIGGLYVLETPVGVPENMAHAALKLRLLLDTSGRVRKVVIVDTPDPRLAKAATAWFENRTFHPAVRESTPVAVWWDRKVLFRPRSELRSEVPSASCVQATYGEALREDDLTDEIELPRILKKVAPAYPRAMEQRRIEGDVSFTCVIDVCGRVRDCRAVASSRAEFEQAGLDAVLQRRYTPARRNGEPVVIMFTVTVTFGLR